MLIDNIVVTGVIGKSADAECKLKPRQLYTDYLSINELFILLATCEKVAKDCKAPQKCLSVDGKARCAANRTL